MLERRRCLPRGVGDMLTALTEEIIHVVERGRWRRIVIRRWVEVRQLGKCKVGEGRSGKMSSAFAFRWCLDSRMMTCEQGESSET